MEVAHPSRPHHKRKGSALDIQLEAGALMGGKAARPSEEGEAEEQQEAMTETCAMHVNQLRHSQEEVLRKIDEITGEAGVVGTVAAGGGR